MKKKNILFFILIILIVIFVFFGITYFSVDKFVKVEVKEISIIQQKFEIEPKQKENVINEENSEITASVQSNDTEEKPKDNTSKKTSKKQNGYGTSSYSGVVTVTPKIRIPRTGINLTLYSEMTVRNMEKGAVIFATDNGLNEVGNTVISAHNTVNGRLFSRNSRIQIGDLIYITDPSGRVLTYTVYNKYITSPNDASYVDRETDENTEISLTTCTDDGSQRIIIWAYAM